MFVETADVKNKIEIFLKERGETDIHVEYHHDARMFVIETNDALYNFSIETAVR